MASLLDARRNGRWGKCCRPDGIRRPIGHSRRQRGHRRRDGHLPTAGQLIRRVGSYGFPWNRIPAATRHHVSVEGKRVGRDRFGAAGRISLPDLGERCVARLAQSVRSDPSRWRPELLALAGGNRRRCGRHSRVFSRSGRLCCFPGSRTFGRSYRRSVQRRTHPRNRPGRRVRIAWPWCDGGDRRHVDHGPGRYRARSRPTHLPAPETLRSFS
jgi:hypothetical protein